MIIITSAAFVVSEIRNEIGSLPPALLPIGNKRLLSLQVDALRARLSDDIYLSLPAGFSLGKADMSLIESLGVSVIYVPTKFNLAESLTYVLVVSESQDTSVKILHGDTLINDIPIGEDLVGLGASISEYDWEVESRATRSDASDTVWAGYFAFSDKATLLRGLVSNSSSFSDSVRFYCERKQVAFPFCESWRDFGHVNSYFISRASVTTERSFNSLNICEGVVTKSSLNKATIMGEINWYTKIPPTIKKYTPQLLEHGYNSEDLPYYCLEYMNFLPLNELYVFGLNSIQFWKKIFNLLKKFLADARSECVIDFRDRARIHEEALWLAREKTIQRLDEHISKSTLTLDRNILDIDGHNISIRQIRDEAIAISSQRDTTCSILHGDLCLSNILYDSRADRIKVIDPRGTSRPGSFRIDGDQNYDLAKLAHSILGNYDHIIAGHFKVSQNDTGSEKIEIEVDERIIEIQALFQSEFLDDQKLLETVMADVVLLFLSMLPLHHDRPDRQKAMLLNSARLYEKFVYPLRREATD